MSAPVTTPRDIPWAKWAKFFEDANGFAPSVGDSLHERLFANYLKGTFDGQDESTARIAELRAALLAVADEARVYPDSPRSYSGDSYLPAKLHDVIRAALYPVGPSIHTVDALKQLGVPMTPEVEAQARAYCDELVDENGEGHEPEPCPTCNGSGQYDDATPCPDCDGDGTVPY